MDKNASPPKDENSGLNSSTQQQQMNWDGVQLCQIQGFWCPDYLLRPLKSFQKNFKSHDADVIIASLPKSGTTWLKSLIFSIVNRTHFPIDQSPLLKNNGHKLVPSLECTHYLVSDNPDLENITHPRLFSTHLPHKALAPSLIESKSKIVYVSRNPLDQFVSERQFRLKVRKIPDANQVPVEEAFDMFVRGVHAFGPTWDHVLGYWNATLENPDKVLFLTYEDLKRDPFSNVRRIAEFLLLPFSDEEESEGLPGQISQLCSFENLSNLETNKNDPLHFFIHNSWFFRKGEIGDWKNHLTPAMAERMKQAMDANLSGTDLTLRDHTYCRS